ncbi:hypothetical protein SETIT_2G019400v2 [Setaria italica]|uniref:Uncharacterized protein n=2 Tax=Setaria italica TaxID=4555 RepID=A0A368PU69_SETIT|nr:hypothetical protein SETIT_2G019400v2 [Setaria italica]
MAEMVGSAVVQEAEGRISSFVFGKRKGKASEGHSLERLDMALSELEFALERSAKLPITDVSLLCRRKVLKHAYVEGRNLLNKHKGRLQQEGQEIGRVCRGLNLSLSLIGLKKDESPCLSCSDVKRFEWFADCASKFVRDMESGCSLRQYTFCNPLVRHLLQGKMLEYEVVQRDLLRRFHIWPISLEERGVEAELAYRYDDRKMPHKSFQLRLMLRLSESTDIIGIAIECLQSLESQHVTRSAMGELTLLRDLQFGKDISHKYALPWVGIQESHTQDTWIFRPDPICCKSNGQESFSNNIISSTFPEQVIFVAFRCYVSALEYSLCHSSSVEASRNAMKDRASPLQVTSCCAPHFGEDLQLQESSCAHEVLGSTFKHKIGSIQEMEEMVRTKAARQPEQSYSALWLSAHGSAYFCVRKSCSGMARVPEPNGRSKTRRAAKRKR